MKKLFKSLITSLSLFLIIPSLASCSEAWEATKDNVSNWWENVSQGATDTWDKVVKYSEPIIDKVKDGAQYVYDNVVHYSKEPYDYMQKKAQEIVGNVQEYFTGTNENDLQKYEIIYGEEQEEYHDDLKMEFDNPQGLNRVSRYSPKFESFMPYYVSTILKSNGFDVYYGVAFLKGNHYTGLIFTMNDTYIEYQKQEN